MTFATYDASRTLTLPEMYHLLTLDEGGRPMDSTQSGPGTVAAALCELVLREKLTPDGKHVVLADDSPTDSSCLDKVLARVKNKRGRAEMSRLMYDLQHSIPDAVSEDLVRQGILEAHTDKVLGVFPLRRTSPRDVDQVAALKMDVRRTMLGMDRGDDRIAIAALLLDRSQLTKSVYEDLPKKDKERTQRLVEGAWQSEHIGKLMKQMDDAIASNIAVIVVAVT